WRQPTIREKLTQRWVDMAINTHESRQQAVLPAFFPIAAAGKLIYRSYYGIHAVDLKTGKLVWESPSVWSLDVIGREKDGNTAQQMILNQWFPLYTAGGTQGILFENSTLGTLSTDNTYVYAVEDLVLPPHPQILQQMMWGGQPNFGPFN